MPAFPAFFDTSSLYGGVLNDLFLRLAEEGAYRLIWSEQILVELERNLPIVWARVPRADEWTPCGKPFPMPVDSGDRHVAAAAAHAGAEVIVTANLKHFPVEPLAVWPVTRTHPDGFLLDQLDLYPEIGLQASDVVKMWSDVPRENQ